MVIKKRTLKTRPVTKLTFELPSDYDAERVELVAEFNDWEPVEFDRLKSGKWKLQQEVEQGREFQFRYRAHRNGEVWYDNDPEADRYVHNEYGTDNAVVES